MVRRERRKPILAAAVLGAFTLALSASPMRGLSNAPSNAQSSKTAKPTSGGATGTAATRSRTPAPAAKAEPPADPVAAAWKLLEEGAVSDKYPTRSDAVSALVVLGTLQRSVNMMVLALDDKQPIIRVLAATSLGEVKARAAIPALRASLEDKDPQVSFAAAQALWKMGDRSGRNDLYAILEGERKTQSGLIKGNLQKAAQELHQPKALILIGVNSASSALLGPGALGVSAVEELATNHLAPAQALCANLLADDDTPDTVNELRQALSDKSWVVRSAAARALANLNHAEVIPQLTGMMQNDPNHAARYVAAAAIIRLDQEQRLGAAAPAARQPVPPQPIPAPKPGTVP